MWSPRPSALRSTSAGWKWTRPSEASWFSNPCQSDDSQESGRAVWGGRTFQRGRLCSLPLGLCRAGGRTCYCIEAAERPIPGTLQKDARPAARPACLAFVKVRSRCQCDGIRRCGRAGTRAARRPGGVKKTGASGESSRPGTVCLSCPLKSEPTFLMVLSDSERLSLGMVTFLTWAVTGAP